MNCHAIRAVLDLHAEGRLTGRRMNAVSAHLASCEGCRALETRAPSFPSQVQDGSAGLKARLSAAMKSPRAAREPAAAGLALWPRDLAGAVVVAAALALTAAVIGWSGAPSQRDMPGDELAGGRNP